MIGYNIQHKSESRMGQFYLLTTTLSTLHLLLGHLRARSRLSRSLRLDFLILFRLLLRLRLVYRRIPGRQPSSGRLLPHRRDSGHISTDDATLVLHRLPRAFLGDFLRDTLFVHATVQHRPGDLTRVLSLQEKGFIFRLGEAEDFGISTDE